MLGLLILCCVIFLAAIANIIYPVIRFYIQNFRCPPWRKRLFRQRSIGRDVASGIAHGAKTSLLIGLIATPAAVFIGVILGL